MNSLCIHHHFETFFCFWSSLLSLLSHLILILILSLSLFICPFIYLVWSLRVNFHQIGSKHVHRQPVLHNATIKKKHKDERAFQTLWACVYLLFVVGLFLCWIRCPLKCSSLLSLSFHFFSSSMVQFGSVQTHEQTHTLKQYLNESNL